MSLTWAPREQQTSLRSGSGLQVGPSAPFRRESPPTASRLFSSTEPVRTRGEGQLDLSDASTRDEPPSSRPLGSTRGASCLLRQGTREGGAAAEEDLVAIAPSPFGLCLQPGGERVGHPPRRGRCPPRGRWGEIPAVLSHSLVPLSPLAPLRGVPLPGRTPPAPLPPAPLPAAAPHRHEGRPRPEARRRAGSAFPPQLLSGRLQSLARPRLCAGWTPLPPPRSPPLGLAGLQRPSCPPFRANRRAPLAAAP